MITFPNYEKDRKDRLRFFNKKDFKKATVLDLGCNEGGMLKKAKEWGAIKTLGVDYDSELKPDVVADLDEFDWSIIPESDVVMVLSVTNWVKNPQRLVEEAEKKCKKVFYFEGHQQEYVKDNFAELFINSQLEWRKLGEVPNRRPFYRGVRKS